MEYISIKIMVSLLVCVLLLTLVYYKLTELKNIYNIDLSNAINIKICYTIILLYTNFLIF